MGLQLIFVVECDSKSQTDWMYIKSTIDKFYVYNRSEIKFTPIYLAGKGNYLKKKNEIERNINRYNKVSKANQSKVICCFDCDNYDYDAKDEKFLIDAKAFCDKNNYEFVWFCKDIEQVYVGESVENSSKRQTAYKFISSKEIKNISRLKLNKNDKYIKFSSNILTVLDKIENLNK